jgi:hypothetical protein
MSRFGIIWQSGSVFLQEKETSTTQAARVSKDGMKTKKRGSNGSRVVHATTTAMDAMELYCAAHPRGPSAVRRPQLSVRGGLWIALLGPGIEEGVIGIGATVEEALRAFDEQYLAGLRPPARPINSRLASRNSRISTA